MAWESPELRPKRSSRLVKTVAIGLFLLFFAFGALIVLVAVLAEAEESQTDNVASVPPPLQSPRFQPLQSPASVSSTTDPLEVLGIASVHASELQSHRSFDLAFIDEVVEKTTGVQKTTTAGEVRALCSKMMLASMRDGDAGMDDLLFNVFSERQIAILGALSAAVPDATRVGQYCRDLVIESPSDISSLPTPAAVEVVTLSPSITNQTATPDPTERQWTAQELLECDTTTLTRQQQGRSLPGEKLSDCEVAYTIAVANTWAYVNSETNGLRPGQRRALLEHYANMEELAREITKSEISSILDVHVSCNQLPSWAAQTQGAREYLEILDAPDLLGWEIAILNAERFISGMVEVCANVDE